MLWSGSGKRRILCCTQVCLVFAAIVAAGFAVAYVCYSWQNPKVIEIVFGSILITLLLGSSTTLFSRLFGEPKSHKGAWFWLLMSVSLLVVVIAFLVYASNTPKDITEDIPVVYLIDPTTNLLAHLGLAENETGAICYLHARLVLQRLQESEPKAKAAIGSLNTRTTSADDMMFLHRIFQDLTEYLLVYHLGNIFFAMGEGERTLYGGRALRWIARPGGDIAAESQTLGNIEKQFAENLFYGVKTTMDSNDPWQFHLPKGSQMRLQKGADTGITVLTIETKRFMRIDIAVQYLWNSSQGYVVLRESEEAVNAQDLQEPYRSLRRFQAVIHYDVKFDKRRYGYAIMRQYERWATDLLAVLQRQFSWGNPRLADTGKVPRYPGLREKTR